MKRLNKRISIYLTTFILMFSISMSYFCVPVKADLNADDAYQIVGDLVEIIGADREITPNIIRDAFYKCMTQNMGFIGKTITPYTGDYILKGIAKHLNNKYGVNSYTKDNLTSSDLKEVAEDFTQNVVVNNDNSLTYNDYSKNMLNLCAEECINDSGMIYTFSQDFKYFPSQFATQDLYRAYIDFCETYQDDYYIVNWSGTNFAIVSQNSYAPIITANSVGYKVSTLYSLSTWTNVPDTNDFQKFTYDSNTKSIVASETLYKTSLSGIYSKINAEESLWGGNAKYISYGKTFAIPTFTTLARLQDYSVGQAPYYYNSQVYNNWKNTTGDYTVNNDNSNKVTYGDIVTYNNQKYIETGNYPTPTEIEIHIIQESQPTPTPTPNPDNPSGGGSGGAGGQGGSATATANNSGVNVTVNNNHQITLGWPFSGTVSGNGTGGTVSGNGSGEGSSGGLGNIFGFLGYIGDLIGDLISGIGSALVGILEGVAAAVQVVTEGIPNVLGPLIGFIFNGLPEEITALLTLCITSVLLIAIVKAIRK